MNQIQISLMFFPEASFSRGGDYENPRCQKFRETLNMAFKDSLRI